MVDILFYAMAFVAVCCAAGVVFAKTPVGSLLFMVATLANLAGIYVLLEAHFLAAVQIIVYAGAIMVRVRFVMMLLNLGHEYRRDLQGGVFAILSFIVIGALAGVLARQFGAPSVLGSMDGPGAQSIDAALAQHGAVGAIGQSLFTDYLVPFEITGILLLVAVVGALALAKRKV